MARRSASLSHQLAHAVGRLARTPSAVGKQSREIEVAVTRLIDSTVRQARGRSADTPQYRVDELAQITGTTTRNIRAYRERGLLPAPRKVGRVTFYSDDHVERLELINSMLGRGYSIAHIDELLTAWRDGKQLNDILGVKPDLTLPTETSGAHTTVDELLAGGMDARSIDRLQRLGLLGLDESGAVSLRYPDIVEALTALITASTPAEQVVELAERLTPALIELERVLVAAATDLTDATEDEEDLAELTVRLVRLRMLGQATLDAVLDQVTVSLLNRETESETS
ncbi:MULTISPECIES: MerR family transcriptional regulator [unclassified Gordonia (in: high G+C Gram-positive bacteria)]